MTGYLVMTRHRKDDLPVKFTMSRGDAFNTARELHKQSTKLLHKHKRPLVSKIDGYAWGSARPSDLVCISIIEFDKGIPIAEILALPIPSVRKQSDDPK